MRILLFLLFFSFSIHAQDYKKLWSEAIQEELDGKTESAYQKVQNIYAFAKKSDNEVQIIKCFFYQSKFRQVLEEKWQDTIISDIKNEIATSKPISKAILNYLYGKILLDYANYNRYDLQKTTPSKGELPPNIAIWSLEDFRNEIGASFQKVYANKALLAETPITAYKEIIEIPSFLDGKNYSLLEFLHTEIVKDYRKIVADQWDNINTPLHLEQIEKLYTKTENFINLKETNYPSYFLLLLNILQEKERFDKNNNPSTIDVSYCKRLEVLDAIFQLPELSNPVLDNIEKQTNNPQLHFELFLKRIKRKITASNKEDNPNTLQEAIIQLDAIIKANPDAYITAEAQLVKDNILEKSLTIQLNKINYEGENTRAFIDYKNVKQFQIHYFKINNKDYLALSLKQKNKEDAFEKYLKNKKAFLETTVTLPKAENHYPYSTEILMDKLPLGNYFLTIEDTDKESNSLLEKKYLFYQVSNIAYVNDSNDAQDLYYLLHRKTGEPLTNAFLINKKKKIKADAQGKISYPKISKKNKTLETHLIHNQDTIAFYYNIPIKYPKTKETEEDFKAKVMFYLDRAIYRPGQKVHFKGIMVQDKNHKKSVVPFLSVHVTISDASYQEIEELDIQTNEFGSFSGDFAIPKNCMTGQFFIRVEEPDDEFLTKDKKYYDKKEEEHSFWTNVDLEDDSINFKVEEYKRPSFEIKVEKIKKIFGIGDTIQLKGNVKSLAGSNVSNAKVKYSIDRSYYTQKLDHQRQLNYIQKEITTDLKGNFYIPLILNVDNLQEDDIISLDFDIHMDVTDTNGETHSKDYHINSDNTTLEIDPKFVNEYYEEEQNYVNIVIKNKDNQTIPYSGKIAIYKREIKPHLKPRAFNVPEIQAISKEKFEKLFPYEPYEFEYQDEIVLVDSLKFDTNKSNEIALPKLLKGLYTIEISIMDTKGTSIKEKNNFEIKSKDNPSTENKIFAVRRVNKNDQGQLHFEFTSSLPKLYITTRLYQGKKLVSEKITSVINGKGNVSIEKLIDSNHDHTFFFSTQWENYSYSEDVTIAKEVQKRNWNFEAISFRNKIEPGSHENWTFQLSNPSIETEVLASMYDTSLDAFAKSSWNYPMFYEYIDPDFPKIHENNTQQLSFTTESKKVYYKKIQIAPSINWSGFNFIKAYKNYKQIDYEQKTAKPQILRKGTKTITGIVSDANGSMPGVNVVIKGTQIGVSTNFDGSYTINAKKGEILVFSFMGMKDVNRIVEDSNVVDVVLKDATTKLTEVIVTAVGIKKSNSFNPNIIVVTSNDENLKYFNEYSSNVIAALSGKVSGLMITSSSENVSTSNIVRLRAPNSITADQNALLVMDGKLFIGKTINSINQDEIDSITILKAKEATSLYGADGRNGVIIINTKKAVQEMTAVNTRTNFKETAFFYPHLVTNKEGKISFSFTTPESLTKWKLRLIGQDKDASFGNLESEIIARKELMISPNMPRFLREKDSITLTANIYNATDEIKTGTAILQLFDAQTGNAIDIPCNNVANSKSFDCKAHENVTLYWKVFIPENITSIRYKVVAKSGNYSDGEENILPVLSNRIAVTESLPIWVRERTKKEFVLENLKKNSSSTLQNQSFTFEYTSNPTWLAIHSLPYLMEYEHECAEQTFARYYANSIALNIINSNPKIASYFTYWKNKPNKTSKLEENEALKSIIARETPWVLDANEKAKNKRLADLFDLQELTKNSSNALQKLQEKQDSSGGFPWFEGGTENVYITQHILSGLGHLEKLFPSQKSNKIADKGIPFIDANFMENTAIQKKQKLSISDKELQYLYCRSFYLEKFPVKDSIGKTIQYQIEQTKSNWLQYGIGQKAMLALSSYRFGDLDFAKKIITHLRETAIKNSEKGMYWLENKNGWKWFESPIENQVLLIEAFSEIDKDKTTIDNLKAWLIHKKQRENWGTTKATSEAVYALLLEGNQWINNTNNTTLEIGNATLLQEKLDSKTEEIGSGYYKLQWKPEEITKELATIRITNKNQQPSFGGVYWQYFEELDAIKETKNENLEIKKEVFIKIKNEDGFQLLPIQNNALKIGDLVTIRLVLKVNQNLEFVHVKDLRASCLEPVDVLSTYHDTSNLWYYQSSKDTATHFFMDSINEGSYIIEYDVRITNSGTFNNGIATIQSMYAPEFSAHSSAQKIKL